MGFFQRQLAMQASASRRQRRHAYRKRFSASDRYVEMCHGSDVPRPWLFELLIEELHMGLLEDVFGPERSKESDVTADDQLLSDRCPVLHALMVCTPLVAGKRRQVSTMTLVAEDGVWKAGLRDRDRNVSLWVSGESLMAALDVLERALNQRPVAWRKTPEAYSRGRQKS